MSGEADEQRARQQQENLKDSGFTTGDMFGAAVATAAATAFFYRNGGGSQVARYLEKGYRYTTGISALADRHLSGKSTISDYKAFYKDAKAKWKTIGKELKDKPIELDAGSTNTLFGYISSMRNNADKVASVARARYRQQQYIEPTRKFFEQNYNKTAGQDINRARRFYNYIDDLAYAVDDKEKFLLTQKNYKFKDEDKKIAEQLEDLIRQQKKNANKEDEKSIRKQVEKQFQDLMAKGFNVDSLAQQFGTSTTPKDTSTFLGSMRRALDSIAKGMKDRAATNKDILNNLSRIRETYTYGTSNKKDPTSKAVSTALKDWEKLNQQMKEQGDEVYNKWLDITPDKLGLRVDGKGRLYSMSSMRKIREAALSFGAGTLPGKILKLRSFQYDINAPAFQYFVEGSLDPVLAGKLNKDKNKPGGAQRIDATYYQLGKKLYQAEGDKVNEIEDAAGLRLISARYGPSQRLLNSLVGNTRYKQSDNYIFNKLDMFQDREDYGGSLLGKFKTRFSKFDNPEWRGNRLDRLLHPTFEQTQELLNNYNFRNHKFPAFRNIAEDYGLDYAQDARFLENFLREHTYDITRKSVSRLIPKADESAAKYFNMLMEDTGEDTLKALMSLIDSNSNIINQDLKALIKRVTYNQHGATHSVMLKTNRDGTHLTGDFFDILNTEPGNESATFYNQLKTEILKEGFLQQAAAKPISKDGKTVPDYQRMLNLIEDADLDNSEAKQANRLALFAMFQNRTGINIERPNRTADQLWNEISRVNQVLYSSKNEEDKLLRSTIDEIAKEQITSTESMAAEQFEDIADALHTPDWIHVGTSIGPLDLIKSLNDTTKFKATAKQFAKQLNAGYKNPGDITSLTLAPYFMLARLSDELNSVGLGFSRDSMGSTGELLKSFALKRILPVAVGATYLEWADDTSQELTGTSILSAGANGLANADLAMRKTFDMFGITDWLNAEKSINPIMQYWGDHTPFMSYDERKKYYESGYDPVRKGAWWTFGGVSEARGGEITYWQPSFVRRINSDYEDVSLYDGYFDKWSHSLLPTPSNPLSPLMAILDPYWLEEKHADDRPYPVSGPMFAQNTPWGAILNPTIGALIKPEVELHPWRLNNGVDGLSLLKNINDYIKAKAQDATNSHLFTVTNNTVKPVMYTPYSTPDEDSYVTTTTIQNDGSGNVTIRQNRGLSTLPNTGMAITGGALPSVSGVGVMPTARDFKFQRLMPSDINNYSNTAFMPALSEAGATGVLQEGNIVTKDNKVGMLTSDNDIPYVGIALTDKLAIDRAANGDPQGYKANIQSFINNIDPLGIVHDLNSATIRKAESLSSGGEEEGVILPEKLRYFTPSTGMQLLDDADTVAELINAGKGEDFVKDAATSARLISGIYGYMVGATVGLGDQTGKHIAQSSDMTSFSRTFWDENWGGAGGGLMEIARRFIPDYKRGTIVNPLRNTMPDWLPERYQFGSYGAFDRFKILADIAPFSPEFKIWKQIAKQTVTDPNLVAEMDEITQRVNQQGKKHDFYDYNVVGRGVEYKNIVVSEVLDYGKFKSGDTIYKLAGAKIKGNADETMQQVLSRYIRPGDEITIAVDEDEAAGTNNDANHTVNAAVFNQDGENVANLMMEQGDASKKKGDTSAPATLVNYSGTQKMIGYVSEVIAHLDVPWLSDQFLRVRSPLESYSAEQVYGTPYQSWEHPLDTFLFPAMERAVHERAWIPTAAWEYFREKPGLTPGAKKLMDATYVLNNRGAFIGAAISNLIKPGDGTWTKRSAKLSGTIQEAAHFLSGGTSYVDEISQGAMFGYKIVDFFEKESKGKAVLIGAAVGAAYRMLQGDNSDWVSNRTKRKWDTQEYFDRLTYIKYMGLYHEAARRALDEEGVDVETFQNQVEQANEKREKALQHMQSIKDILNQAGESPERERLLKIVNTRINALQNEPSSIQGGEWTHSALIYKQAAENTMTALNPNSTWSQIVTALPTNDREYFMEFVKVRDSDKRQEILKTVSPQMRKALMLAWGKITDKPDIEAENEAFFEKHDLPTEDWIGWRPDVDLKDIQVKTIANEGQNLSDFGFYESQLRQPQVINAPSVHYRSNTIHLQSTLQRVLQGQGLEDVNVSVTEGAVGSGHQIISNIATFTGLRELQKMTDKSLTQGVG